MAANYTGSAFARAVIVATVIAGTLDLLAAFTFAAAAGDTPVAVLRGIGSAILDPHDYAGSLVPALAGLALHFGIAAAMADAYIVVAARLRAVNAIPVLSGIAYGLILWWVMDWIVLPQRWPMEAADPVELITQLFCHIIFVGVPIALVAARAAQWR